MKIDKRRTAFFDVDGTLIDHKDEPILPIVAQMRARKEAGYAIVVWSAGGPEWAKRAINLLNLEEYVDYIMDKPTVTYDDLPPLAWANWWDVTKENL